MGAESEIRIRRLGLGEEKVELEEEEKDDNAVI